MGYLHKGTYLEFIRGYRELKAYIQRKGWTYYPIDHLEDCTSVNDPDLYWLATQQRLSAKGHPVHMCLGIHIDSVPSDHLRSVECFEVYVFYPDEEDRPIPDLQYNKHKYVSAERAHTVLVFWDAILR